MFKPHSQSEFGGLFHNQPPIVDHVTELTSWTDPQSTRLVAMITLDPECRWYSLPISRDVESPYSFYYKGETFYIPEDAYREYIKYMESKL